MKRAAFVFDKTLDIQIPSKLHSTMIYLRLQGIQSDQSNYYPISGFPRFLITEDTLNGIMSKTPVNQHLLMLHQLLV